MKLPQIQLFYQFLARLSKREKLIFYVALTIISFMILDRLIISPISYKMASLDEEIREKVLSIKRSLYLLSHKDRILAEINKYSPYLSSARPDEEEMTSVLKDIENIANKASVYLVDMKPSGFKEVGSYKECLVKLSCEAQMEQITDFMYSIENSKQLFTITKYQISPKSKESSVAGCSMTISKILLP